MCSAPGLLPRSHYFLGLLRPHLERDYMVLWHFWAKPSAWRTVFVPPTNTHIAEASVHRCGWCFTKKTKGWSGFLKQQKQSCRWSILIGYSVPLCLIPLHFLTHPHLQKMFFIVPTQRGDSSGNDPGAMQFWKEIPAFQPGGITLGGLHSAPSILAGHTYFWRIKSLSPNAS